MTRLLFSLAFLIGVSAVVWMGQVFIGKDVLALTVTLLIGSVFTIGTIELLQFRRDSRRLALALVNISAPVENLNSWLNQVPASLQNAVQHRIEGERIGLPAPVLTPYLVGLLVMLGLLGTFVGMVDTLQGAVGALRESSELEAIRAGLATPIQGLSVAFGTSVAGVAASAMLGLMSTLSRRDRMAATRQLDRLIATDLRNFSLGYNRQETYKALQAQAQALPDVAEKLGLMAEKLEIMGESLGQQLNSKQDRFNAEVSERYTELADSVAGSLQESLSKSGKLAGESIKPVVTEVLNAIRADLAASTAQTHQYLTDLTRRQFETLGTQFGAVSAEVSESWQQGIATHEQHNSLMVEKLHASLGEMSAAFEKMGAGLLSSMHSNASELLEQHANSDRERFAHAAETLTKSQQEAAAQLSMTVSKFGDEMQRLGDLQESALASTSKDFSTLSADMSLQWQQADTRAQERSDTILDGLTRLFHASEQLVETRQHSEDEWLTDNRARMESFTSRLSEQLESLRDAEQQRGDAAVERLSELQTTLAENLATLGHSLEAPMTRLIETASETPKAAAELIARLRDEISKNIERDNSLLEERKQTMGELNELVQALHRNTGAQGEAIARLVNQSTELLQDVGGRFNAQVDADLGKLGEVAEYFSGSAAEMASLGEAFAGAVKMFGESNRQLVESLAGIEESLEQSTLRSDEQLGYYVAQARDIIDHSLSSQREIFAELRQFGKAASTAAEAN